MKWSALLALGCAACFPSGGGSNPGGPVGFGAPMLEVTIDGNRLGPATPDPGSTASLVDTHDQLGQVATSDWTLLAASTAAGATCDLRLQRYGNSAAIAPFAVGMFQITDPGPSGTADGTATPLGGERVIGPGDSWECAGSSCNGAVLVIQAMDSLHVEGYFSGTLASDSGGPPADIVCSFYVQYASYAP
jgi:hypothetical protein